MSLFRRGRFFYWLARELSQKYTRSLVIGVSLGFAVSVFIWKVAPYAIQAWFSPVERIGVVGEFTPTSLPRSIQESISTGLTTIAPDGSASAGLAQSWEATESGKTSVYTFHLRPDAFWHDGKPVKASDVNYNIRNVSFSVIDEYTLQATLTDPYSPFPTLVAKPIMERGLRGFGPYKVAGLQLKGDTVQHLKLLPIGDGRKRAKEYRFYRTEAQAILAYKQGDVDVLEDMSSAEALKQWGKTQTEDTVRYDRIVTIFFNTKADELSERSFRQALGYAVPEFSEERAFSPLSRTSWAYMDKIRHYDTNLTQAKKLLTSSKIASGSSELTIITFAQYVNIAQEVANSWTSLGVPTKVKVENVLPSQYEVLLSAQSIPPDPDQYPFWHSTQQQTNITGYANVKIDKLLEDARREPDINKRKRLYADFQRFLVEDAPALFLYYPKTYTVRRTQ